MLAAARCSLSRSLQPIFFCVFSCCVFCSLLDLLHTAMEMQKGIGQVWHKLTCFKCQMCNARIEPGSGERIHPQEQQKKYENLNPFVFLIPFFLFFFFFFKKKPPKILSIRFLLLLTKRPSARASWCARTAATRPRASVARRTPTSLRSRRLATCDRRAARRTIRRRHRAARRRRAEVAHASVQGIYLLID